MAKAALVIMAAGMGSRYGGMKQIEPVGPNGEIILDYSVYDAVKAGFDQVYIIIRKEMEKDFQAVIGDRLERVVELQYIYQDMDCLPGGFKRPENRVKPWGTGHAILSLKGKIKMPFAVINADDYYGREAFSKLYQFLINSPNAVTGFNFCMAGFHLGNTLSEFGTVTRGICTVEGGLLKKIKETYQIKKGETAAYTQSETIPFDQPVSMNMWGFTPDFLEELESGMAEFLSRLEESDLTAEYLLPTIIGGLLEQNKVTVHVLETRDRWFGVTYREDKAVVEQSFRELVEKGLYPERLFSE